MVILLPVPLSPTTISLGQLLSVPGDTSSTSFRPSSSPEISKAGEIQTTSQSQYETLVSQDNQGRLLSRPGEHDAPSNTRGHQLVLIRADEMQYTSIKHPATSFDALTKDHAVQTFLCSSALPNQPLYYVVGMQTVSHPSFRRAIIENSVVVEDPAFKEIPGSTQGRRDSGTALLLHDEGSTDLVIGLELRRVKARVGFADEPHAIEDIEYDWTYYRPNEDKDIQLSVGLGRAVRASEWKGAR